MQSGGSVQSRPRLESYESRGGSTSSPGKQGDGIPNIPGHAPPEVDVVEVIRQKLKKFMAQSTIGHYYENFLLVLSVVSCFEYIYQTYLHHSVAEDRRVLYRLNVLELVFAIVFGIDWSLNCFLAEHRILFFTSFFSMVDLLTVIPIFVTFGRDMPNVNYVYNVADALIYTAFAMNTTRILRALRIRRKLAQIEDAVERFMGELMLSIIVMILFFASVMQFLEYTYQPHSYHTWMYYIWVTISTVGYGDITPKSTQGRVAVMCIIGFSIISIPKMTNELIEKMALQSVYMRNSYTPKSKHSKHIVICGDISSISLHEFFEELFHEDHENVDLNAILLLPTPPTTDMIFLLRDSNYFLNLMYLEGSALVDSDLKRAKAQLAAAIFIMTNKFSAHPDEEDAKSILLNLSIKRYVASFQIPPKLFCMQLIRPSNRKHLGRDLHSEGGMEDKDLVVCLNEIKMGVLAKAVMYPGANTLLMNLISSFSDDEIPGGDGEAASPSNSWMSEYTQGCGWEIYTTPLSPQFKGRKFCELSYDLYKRIGLILFGLQITDPYTGKAQLLLNPAEYIIPEAIDTVLAFVIAENKQSSDLTFSEANKDKDHWIFSFFDSDAATATRSRERLGQAMNWFSASHGALASVAQKDSSDGPPPTHSPVNEPGQEETGPDVSHSPVPQVVTRPSNIELLSTQAAMQAQSQNELLVQVKETHFRTHYYLRDEFLSLKDATIKNSILDVFPNIKKHIIIIGREVANLFDLIRPLRAKYVGVLRHIVILSPDAIPPDVWSRVAMFDAISVVRGSPLEERNLRRAGIFMAKRVVVLADGTADSNSNKASSMAALVDSDAIFAYQRVRKMNPKAQVVIEMINTSNIGYLYSPTSPDISEENVATAADYKFSHQFAAGELFTTSLLDSIVCQGYYNPHIINVIDKLISGVDVMTRNELIANATDSFKPLPSRKSGTFDNKEGDRLLEDSPSGAMAGAPLGRKASSRKMDTSEGGVFPHGSCLYQIALPSDLVGKTYGSLYKKLSKKGIIPLGLLRGTGSPTLVAPYVSTNPSYDTELNVYDRVFILSVKPITDEQDGPMDPNDAMESGHKRISRKSSLFQPNFSGSVADGLSIHTPAPFQELSALAVNQQQLRQELQILSNDVNRKFDALMTAMQRAEAPSPSSGATAPVTGAAHPQQQSEARGPVRLAPLHHPAPAQQKHRNSGSDQSSSLNGGHDQRHDSIPSDTTEVPALRTSSLGSPTGVFSFPSRRSRGASIGVDDGYLLTETDVLAATAAVKSKPNNNKR